jgi:putative membrane protein
MIRSTMILAAVAGMATARADDKKPAEAPYSDAKFVSWTGACTTAGAQAAEMATTNAKSNAVKALAQKMIDDHKKTPERWKEMAEKVGQPATAKLDEEHQKCVTKLKELKGAEFDKEFLLETIKGHEIAVKQFKKAKETTENDAIRDFIGDTLPILENNLEIARKVQADGK